MSRGFGGQLVVGEVYAKRAFLYTPYFPTGEPLLASPVRDFMWKDGVNEAHCVFRNGDRIQGVKHLWREFDPSNPIHIQVRNEHLTYGDAPGYNAETNQVMEPVWETIAHHIAGKGCSCGFYAYWYDEYNEYNYPNGAVEGIIKATGHVTAGSRGIRAERAEIVALVPQENTYYFYPDLWERIMERYPSVKGFDSMQDAQGAFPQTFTPPKREEVTP